MTSSRIRTAGVAEKTRIVPIYLAGVAGRLQSNVAPFLTLSAHVQHAVSQLSLPNCIGDSLESVGAKSSMFLGSCSHYVLHSKVLLTRFDNDRHKPIPFSVWFQAKIAHIYIMRISQHGLHILLA